MNNSNIAIGLRYQPDFPAPQVLFKAKGEMAEKVLLLAEKFQIPQRRQKTLATLLYQLPEGSWIPEEHFEIIATLLAQIYQLKGHTNESLTK